MKTIKYMMGAALVIITSVACTKFEFKNPWDKNADITNSEWSPQITSINNVSITSKEIVFEIEDYNIEGFFVDRKEGNQQWVEKYKTLDANVERFTDDDILPDTSLTYYYRISSFAGEQKSMSAEAHSQAQFNAPDQMAVQQVNEKEYIISWEDQSTGEEGFELWKKKNNDAWYKLAILPPNTEVYVDTNVFENKNEWDISYKVKAFYQEYYSSEKTTSLEVGLDSPDSLKLSFLDNVSLQLSWVSNSTGEDGFLLERKEENGAWVELIRTKDTSFLDDSFSVNTNLQYRISAYIGSYQSAYDELNYESAILAPTDFIINKNSNFSINIEWSYHTEGHQGFKIDRKLNDEEWEIEYAVLEPDILLFTDNDVSIQNNDYTYRIYAVIDTERSDYLERLLHIPDIGEFYAGGYVYYLDANVGGMVVGKIATLPQTQWGCWGTWVSATGEDVGDGLQNTINFISNCDDDWRGAWNSYNWESEGYDDWFMPSKESIQLIYERLFLQGIGDFQEDMYWTSSEYNEGLAWQLQFRTGEWYKTDKSGSHRLRSVRFF